MTPALMDPRDVGLLNTALALMAGSGPSRTPVSFGQVLGQAGMQGLGAYQQAVPVYQAQQQEQQKRMALAQLAQDPKFAGLQNLLAVDPKTAIERAYPKVESPFAKINPHEYTPESVGEFARTNNPAVLVPVRKREVLPGGQVIDPYAVQPGQSFPDPNKPFSAGPAGPVANVPYQDYETRKAEAGSTRVQQNVNAFTPASEEAQRRFMDSTRTNYEALRNAPVTLKNIEEAKALIPAAKGFMGTGGETMLEAAKFLNNRLGMNISTEGVKNAEELRSRVFLQIMDNLKKMDAQPSEMQQRIMMDALGKLGTDPNALPAVLDAFGDVVRGKVDIHNKEVEGAEQRGVRFPYNPRIDLQAKAKSAPKKGDIVDGWEFIGGDPGNRMNWRKK